MTANLRISIHALREEGDVHLSQREAEEAISIHALREEGDGDVSAQKEVDIYFYPRPPRGGRHLDPVPVLWMEDFYPRPPRGGRQQKQRQNLYFQTNYTTFCTNLEEP